VNVTTHTRSAVQKDVSYDAFVKVLGSCPKASIEDVCSDGDVVFSVPLSDLGLTSESLALTPLSQTDFFANFVGEYIVRKNINQFADVLYSIDPQIYEEVVCAEEHTGFGSVISKNTIMRFSMHISLVQQILTEDFKKVLE